jgi:hypothetical protein
VLKDVVGEPVDVDARNGLEEGVAEGAAAQTEGLLLRLPMLMLLLQRERRPYG